MSNTFFIFSGSPDKTLSFLSFTHEIISCVRDKDNKVVSGDPEKIKKVLDTWKFSKDSRSSNPNWLLIDTQA